jgi:hypothetical protein
MGNCPNLEVFISLYKAEEGGRIQSIVGRVYRPHLRIIGEEEYLGVEFMNELNETFEPGDSFNTKVRLMYYPNVSYRNLTIGTEFEILEGRKIVGKGHVI